jgi:hypothetical protein
MSSYNQPTYTIPPDYNPNVVNMQGSYPYPDPNLYASQPQQTLVHPHYVSQQPVNTR